jgi:hypothetical protein
LYNGDTNFQEIKCPLLKENEGLLQQLPTPAYLANCIPGFDHSFDPKSFLD